MSTRQGFPWRPLATFAAVSIALWTVAMAAAHWYLRRMQPEEARALAVTDADSIGLPLLALALLLAGVVALANVVMAVLLLRRRRGAGSVDRPS